MSNFLFVCLLQSLRAQHRVSVSLEFKLLLRLCQRLQSFEWLHQDWGMENCIANRSMSYNCLKLNWYSNSNTIMKTPEMLFFVTKTYLAYLLSLESLLNSCQWNAKLQERRVQRFSCAYLWSSAMPYKGQMHFIREFDLMEKVRPDQMWIFCNSISCKVKNIVKGSSKKKNCFFFRNNS